ncbi:MAG: cytochrome c-type biogenesis protein [Gemmatimonadales bacterium]
MMLSRRGFLRRAASVPALLVVGQQPGVSSQGRSPGNAADTLPNPIGPRAAALGPLDNDPGVIAIERRLRCTCGCTLDVYTCRTTDFSCTYSPAMHKVVVTGVQHGDPPDRIIQSFVDRYGETVLMAPAARGFNLAGYLVPGLTVTAFGLVLVAWLTRHRIEAVAAGSASTPLSAAPPDPEQLERLRRALDDVDS